MWVKIEGGPNSVELAPGAAMDYPYFPQEIDEQKQ